MRKGLIVLLAAISGIFASKEWEGKGETVKLVKEPVVQSHLDKGRRKYWKQIDEAESEPESEPESETESDTDSEDDDEEDDEEDEDY
jgi:hypothetical protein